jgi:exonuclease III
MLIGCLYLPNGNPAPGPFNYKLRWFGQLYHAANSCDRYARRSPAISM